MNYHVVNGCAPFLTGSATSATVNLNIPDDVTKIRSATLLFNGPLPNTMAVTMNGKALDTFPVNDPGDTADTLNSYVLTSAQIAQLKTGSNSFAFQTKGVVSYTGVSQLELETVYNQPRTIASPPQDFTPRLTATTNSMRIDHIAGTKPMRHDWHDVYIQYWREYADQLQYRADGNPAANAAGSGNHFADFRHSGSGAERRPAHTCQLLDRL